MELPVPAWVDGGDWADREAWQIVNTDEADDIMQEIIAAALRAAHAAGRAEGIEAAAAVVEGEWPASVRLDDIIAAIRGLLPRRVDREGRDVTDLPGLWSEDDEAHYDSDMRQRGGFGV